ncbi:MAG: hypothetical protein ACI8RZ_003979 [Myxococcota bacterium]|jgi:hypothetical protein
MGIFDFFKRQPPAATLNDLILPSAGWEPHEQTDAVRSWFGDDRVPVRALRVPDPSPVPIDLGVARAHYTAESGEMGGVLVELEVVEAAAGSVLRSVFKYPAPNNPMATYIVGILLLSWPDAHIRIHVEDMEHGTTGGREAAVMVILGDAWPKSDEPPVVVDSMEEMFERMAAARAQHRVLPSDDRTYDASFPHHPLSRVRALQAKILDAMVLRDGVALSG